VLAGGVEGAGERLLRTILSVWDDPETRLPMLALVRTGMADEAARGLLQEGLSRLIFGPLTAELGGDVPDRRTALVASQVMGLIMARYVLCLEPLASMPAEEVVAWTAPTIQRYLTARAPDPDS
jgi:hypothetical protein